MTALELISVANQALFVGLFVAVLWRALRQPSRATWDTVLLFGSIAGVVVIARVSAWLGIEAPWLTGVLLLMLNIAPYAMIRLVDDFSRIPAWVLPAGAAAFVVVAFLGFVAITGAPTLYELITIAWFLVVGGYAAYAFGTAAARSTGLTRSRMTAVTIGAMLFIAAVVVLFVDALLVGWELGLATQMLAFAAAIAFFLGFAPPTWIRRAWREPDLRRFLEGSIHLAGVADERRAVGELQRAAAAAFGASGSAIGLAVEDRPVLRYLDPAGEWVEYPDDTYIGGQAFTEQRRIVAMDATATDPEHSDVYQRNAANTVIAAPITSDDRRLGVLTIYADRAPVFIEDDMWLLELLADQAAVLLEARMLSEVENELRAREDAARLKEEFLSAAAHDLRTPLTVVLGQAELLERRVKRDPSAPIDPAGISRMAREARRLRDLVTQLLDAQRLEQGSAAMNATPNDLREIVTSVRQRLQGQGLDLKITMPDEPVIGAFDQARIEQVLDNLVENALKYTSSGELPEVRLQRADGEARIAVIDQGLGIPEDERERIFERFYRASNVGSITDTGIGLGLYICRRIVESHEGRIWVEATPGGGSTFIVALPSQPSPSVEAAPVTDRMTLAGAEAAADA